MRAVRHFLPLQARFIHVEDLPGLVFPILDDGPEMIWVGIRGILISALSLSRVLYVMELIAVLELIKPASAGDELGYGARPPSPSGRCSNPWPSWCGRRSH